MSKVRVEKKPIMTPTDFLAGATSGFVQILIGQPFDIVKVRMQTTGGEAMKIFKKVYNKEGIKGLYRGTVVPLMGQSFCIANQFLGFGLGLNLLNQYTNSGSNPKLWEICCAGAFSGIFYTWIQSPMELCRIKMQIKNPGKGPVYTSSINAGISIFKTHGFKGLYQGYTVSTYREVFGSLVYFLVYEGGIQYRLPKYNNDRKQIPMYWTLLCGGLSGVFYWTSIYPLDAIKSVIQGSDYKDRQGMMTVAKNIYQEKGIKGMFRGLVPAQMRAFACNSVGFYSAEIVRRAFTKDKKV